MSPWLTAGIAVVIGISFCGGVFVGVLISNTLAFFYRKRLIAPQGQPGMPMPPIPRSLADAQRQIVQKMKSIYGPNLSTRQQEMMDEEVEAILTGKVRQRGA